MKLIIYLFICNSIILFAQPDSTEKIDEEITLGRITRVDSLPTIIGGLESFQNRLIYPPNALERKIEGLVIISVTIDSLGNPINPRIMKGIGMGCDEEAIRLARTAKFSPAYDRGKYINYQIVFPIKFRPPKKE